MNLKYIVFSMFSLFFISIVQGAVPEQKKVIRIEQTLRDSLQLPAFYKKYVDADGIAVTSSEKVQDEALYTARQLIMGMLSKRQEIKQYMVQKRCRFMVIGQKE